MATGFSFTSTTPMHSVRAGAAAAAWADGTKVLVTGGKIAEPTLATPIAPSTNSAELYDASTHTWTLSEMTTARSGHTATLLQSGQVLVVGGDNADPADPAPPATAEVYDPATNSWQQVMNNPNSFRMYHAATLLDDGTVLISGGAPSTFYTTMANSTLSTAEIFDPGDDPVNGTWTLTSPMNNGRCYHTSTLLLLPTGPVLVAGGFASAGEGGAFGLPLSSAEVFDPTTGAWSIISSMNNAHAAHTATLLSSNVVGQFEVLVAGGASGVLELSAFAELYEPPPAPATGGVVVGGSWKPVGPMNVGRAYHNATALPPLHDFSRLIQQVLVTAGETAEGELFTLAGEIYDSATGSWTLTGNTTADRTTGIAALLADGTVLLAGGFNADVGGIANSAEIGTGCDANALIVVSPQQTINYGQVPAGTQAVPPDFAPTVENTGNAELTLTATISGPDAALFRLPPNGSLGGSSLPISLFGSGPCISGPTAGTGELPNISTVVEPTFWALSPVPKTCQATLTLGGSNAANVSAGQTWTFPLIAQIVPTGPGLVITIDTPSFPPAGGPQTQTLIIGLESQPNESVAAIVRFPPSPRDGPFTWVAGDYVVDSANQSIGVPITFAPQSLGPKTQTLELISNAEGSPYQVLLQGTGA